MNNPIWPSHSGYLHSHATLYSLNMYNYYAPSQRRTENHCSGLIAWKPKANQTWRVLQNSNMAWPCMINEVGEGPRSSSLPWFSSGSGQILVKVVQSTGRGEIFVSLTQQWTLSIKCVKCKGWYQPLAIGLEDCRWMGEGVDISLGP